MCENTFKAVRGSENTQMVLCSFKVPNFAFDLVFQFQITCAFIICIKCSQLSHLIQTRFKGTLKHKIYSRNISLCLPVSLVRTQEVGILKVIHATRALTRRVSSLAMSLQERSLLLEISEIAKHFLKSIFFYYLNREPRPQKRKKSETPRGKDIIVIHSKVLRDFKIKIIKQT